METKIVVEQLRALAQETRLAAWRLLIEAGPDGMTVGAIGERLGVPPATLSFHLKTLAPPGWSVRVNKGRFIHLRRPISRQHRLLGFSATTAVAGAIARRRPAMAPVPIPLPTRPPAK